MINCTTPNNEANISSLNMLYNVTNTGVIGMSGYIMFNYKSKLIISCCCY